jgi:predicted glycosyltransferase
MSERVPLLFYCQHSLGMGHLVRSLALVAELGRHFRVVFLNGGPLPQGLKFPSGVEVVNLPPLGMSTDGRLVSRDRRRTVERALQLRRRVILETYRSLRPRVVLIELFPFGRKKFAGELVPLLEETRSEHLPRPLVCCSLRDILVGKKADQQKHDARAVEAANRYFDAVLVHSDPSFARLEESLSSSARLRVPVHYTGFVQAEDKPTLQEQRPTRTRSTRQVLVSAGGGLVGEPLFRAAVEAFPAIRRTRGVTMKIVAGPFLPEDAWQSLRVATEGQTGLSLKRFMPDLCAEMRRSAASVSQCGYNTALDVLRAGVPGLVVPFAEGAEDEQTKRARRLERLGALRVLEACDASAARLAEELTALLDFKPQRLGLDLDGARNTACLIRSLLPSRNSDQAARAGKHARRKEARL